MIRAWIQRTVSARVRRQRTWAMRIYPNLPGPWPFCQQCAARAGIVLRHGINGNCLRGGAVRQPEETG
jgi:hypothetical protein